jgi:serine/threonine-protein kinase
VPRTIGGRYELDTLLGKGGIGEVWKARHIALNSHVAIKFLQGGSAVAESAKRRFAAEAQITAQLKTPNAVQVFDFGVTDEGQPYLVMELLEGETLGQRIERLGRLSPAEAARLLGPCARALHRAHQLGIVHRDFKPDNVIICAADHEGNELVKVLDFGIAKLAGALEERQEASAAAPARGAANPSFTKTGTVLGTPLYMAPEQARDATEVDLRADIWAFGVVAFECLTGIPPFTAPTIEELFGHIYAGSHHKATELEPSLPLAFDRWFEVACAPDRDRRFASASAAWKELALILPTEEPNMRVSAPGSDKRVLVVSGERLATDASAATMDAPRRPSQPPRKALPAGIATLQRVTLRAQEAVGGSQQPLVTTAPSAHTPAPAKRGRLIWAAVAAGGLVLLAGAWQLASRKGTDVATAATGAAVTPALPSAPPQIAPSAAQAGNSTVNAPPPTTAQAAAPSSSATVAAPPPSVATTPAQSRRSTRLNVAAAPDTPKPTPSAAPPPPPPPPPSPPPTATAAAPPADPGSYR